MNIFVIASLAFDRIMNFSGLFSDRLIASQLHRLSVSFVTDSLDIRRGGIAGNVAYTLSLLGERPSIVASVGLDFSLSKDFYEKHGIDTSHIDMHDDLPTSVATIMTDQANCQIASFYPGARIHRVKFSLKEVDPHQAWAFIGAGNSYDMLEYAEVAQRRGIPFIVDLGQQWGAFTPEELKKIITDSQFCMMNDYEYGAISERLQSLGTSIEQLTKGVVVTFGEHGAELRNAQEEIRVPACSVSKVADPTGAGDAHRAGFLASLIKGNSLLQCMRVAGTTASYAIEHAGTQEHFFTLDEFRARYRSSWNEPCPV